MPLTKAHGNMYDWVTHMWPCLGGACPHACTYCYVMTGRSRGSPFYQGPPRLNEKDRGLRLGVGKTIFVAHTSDLFALGVPPTDIHWVLETIGDYPRNQYVIQTKNPWRMYEWADFLPRSNLSVGTTIETDSAGLLAAYSKAPPPANRVAYIRRMREAGWDTFLTVEPIMKFDPDRLVDYIVRADPCWVNVGADSKNNHLPEPTMAEALALVSELRARGIEVRRKENLNRLR